MLIISGRLAREPELKKVIIDGKKKFVLDNCVFVNTSNNGKKSVPVNIIAWDKNATYIAENFGEGEKINLVGIEKLDSIKMGNKTYGVCTFTAIKIIDWKIYKAISGILMALITRILNCSDAIAENILSLELLQSSDSQEIDPDTEKEKQDEKDLVNKEFELNLLNAEDDPNLNEENIETDHEIEIVTDERSEVNPDKVNQQEDLEDNEYPEEDG